MRLVSLGIERAVSKVVRVPVLRVPVILASRTLETGGNQSLQAARYLGDLGLAGPNPFRPSGNLGTGAAQSFLPPQVPWGLAELSP